MIITSSLEGHLTIRPDGVEENAVWVGQDGAIILICERGGIVQRYELERQPLVPKQRLDAIRKTAAMQRRRVDRKAVALDALHRAINETLDWKQRSEFWERVKGHASSSLAKVGDGGRSRIVKNGDRLRSVTRPAPRLLFRTARFSA